jgi:hypothetical protein
VAKSLDGSTQPPRVLPGEASLVPHVRHHEGRPVSLRPGLVKVVLPVGGYTSGWARGRLVKWVVVGRRQRRASKEFAGAVVPEPVLTWLETADDRVLGGSSVGGGMLARGVVAAANVAALGAAAEMEPPAVHLQALDAAGTARSDVRNDGRISHFGGRTRSISDSRIG